MNKFKFKRAKTFRMLAPNGDKYVVTYNYGSGRRNRYDVLLYRIGKSARVIGRELTLGYIKELIEKRWNRRGPC